MNVPRFSVARPVFVTMVTLIVVLIGAVSLQRLPVEFLPDIELPTVTISTNYDNASPEEMEQLVTEPIEQAAARTPGVEEITSSSAEGVSQVRVTFTWGTDLDAASNELRDTLDRVTGQLPDDADRPRLRKFDIAGFPILILGASSPLDPVDLTQLIDRQVQYRLEQVPGVAAVDTWGGFDREIQVNLDRQRISALDIPLDRIVAALRAANVNVPAGTIERGHYEIDLRTPGEYTSLDEIRRTVIDRRDGATIHLADIATIIDTHARPTRLTRINGERGLYLAIRKQPDANTVEVARAAVAEVERIDAEMPQLNLITVRNTATYIEQAIGNVAWTVLIGAALAVLVLLVFLRNFRSTLVIALSIPISIIATFALIFFGGMTLNLMTLGGLALGVGIMVDNSIVVLENIYRCREEENRAPHDAAEQGAVQVGGAIIASTLTTLVIFLPLAFVTGVQGVLFQQLALVISFALICSLVVAMSLVPMLASRMLYAPQEMHARRPMWLERPVRVLDAGFNALERAYRAVLDRALRLRWTVVGGSALACVGALLMAPMIGTELMPPTDEGDVRITAEMEVGTRLEVVDRQMREIERIVAEEVGDDAVSTVVRVGAGGWRPRSGARGSVRLTLVPVRQRDRSNVEIADALRDRLTDAVPGVSIRTRAPQEQFPLLGRLLDEDAGLGVDIRGFDLEVLDQLARQVRDAVEPIAGVEDVRINRETGAPQQRIVIDRDRVADLGLSVESVGSAVRTAIAGAVAGRYRTGGDEFDIRLRMADAERTSIEELLDLQVTTNPGRQVPLRSVVELTAGEGPTLIDRKDQQRLAGVSMNVTGRDLGSVAADIQLALQEIPRPAGYEMLIAGEYEDQRQAFRELMMSLVLSLLLVYMVLASQYESLRDPLVVMCTTPVAAIGVIVILLATDTTLNLQSFIGCIMLGGIVVNNAILLVNQANQLQASGASVRQRITEAGRRRLRPILMTTATTVLGLLPLSLGIGEGAEAQAPLARAVIGGLIASTAITLLLIPAVYCLMHRDAREAK